MLFSKVPLHCNNCGDLFIATFQQYDGRVCSEDCWRQLGDKRACSVMGRVIECRIFTSKKAYEVWIQAKERGE